MPLNHYQYYLMCYELVVCFWRSRKVPILSMSPCISFRVKEFRGLGVVAFRAPGSGTCRVAEKRALPFNNAMSPVFNGIAS